MLKFSNKTKESLGYYVYVYSDPDTKQPFYVGKGKGDRVFNHLKDQSESDKVQKIKEIKDRGKEPIIEILAHGLDEETSYKVEAAAIDLIDIRNLTNLQRGHESSTYGKIEVGQLEARYSSEKLNFDEITDNIMLIRINKRYRNNMSPLELYEATRGYWRVSRENAEKVDYALSIYDGIVIEVYEIATWLPALSTFSNRKTSNTEELKERFEFVGKIADDKIRNQYLNKSVSYYFSKGEANPIKYLWKNNK